MCKLDLEDTNFLEDLIEELPKIDNGVYRTEAVELGNILFRLTENKNFSKVNFICSKCGQKSWFDVNLKTFIVSVSDLVCDDCNPVEEDEEIEKKV